MIVKLNNLNRLVAEEIRSVFQASYAVEAKLLNAIDFPPLKRTVDAFVETNTRFYGYQIDGETIAVIEILNDKTATHIQSLVVLPDHFRKGLGHKLVQCILDTYDSKLFTVETGLANRPAIQLYEKFGFKKTKIWDTDHGIRKIKFELQGGTAYSSF